MIRPKCYNRPPYAEGHWENTGKRRGTIGVPGLKPVYRWRWRWFVDRCATHDGTGIGPNGENYPDAHDWDCTGCRWNPREQGESNGTR